MSFPKFFFSVDENKKQQIRKLNTSEIEPTLKSTLVKFSKVPLISKAKYLVENHALRKYEKIILDFLN